MSPGTLCFPPSKGEGSAGAQPAGQLVSEEGLTSLLSSSRERHQRAPRRVSWADIALDVAQIQLLNCPSEESPGRQVHPPRGDQREEESEWPGPFMWTDSTVLGTGAREGAGWERITDELRVRAQPAAGEPPAGRGPGRP